MAQNLDPWKMEVNNFRSNVQLLVPFSSKDPGAEKVTIPSCLQTHKCWKFGWGGGGGGGGGGGL